MAGMKISEFLDDLEKYFGVIRNQIKDDIASELRYIKPNDLPGLLTDLKRSIPATWTPDIKTVIESIRRLKIQPLLDPYKERVCPVCGATWSHTGLCPTCAYNPDSDGSPEQHRQFLEDFRAGRVPRPDIAAISRRLADARKVRP